MMRKIVVFYDGDFDRLPPLVSLLKALKSIGTDLIFIGLDKFDQNVRQLSELGVRYKLVHRYDFSISYLHNPFARLRADMLKRARFEKYRKSIWSVIDSFVGSDNDYILWSHGTDALAALGNRALSLRTRHIHTFYELSEDIPKRVPGFDLSMFYETATLVECERNRAEIRAALNHLPRVPFVIPNCPFSHPRQPKLYVTDDAARAVVESKLKDRFVFLYQGILESCRGGIVEFLEMLCQESPEDVVAVMTWQNDISVDRLRKYDNFVVVPYVRAPRHLEVTSWASVGIAYYNRGGNSLVSLNSVYCAPNKIYEYAGFGLPTVSNDILGLKYAVEAAGAGVCVPVDVASIKSSVKLLKDNYASFSRNAIEMYDSANIEPKVRQLLLSV